MLIGARSTVVLDVLPHRDAKRRKYVALVIALSLGASHAAAQKPFELQFDHMTVPVGNLEASAALYENIRHLERLETPWGEVCADLVLCAGWQSTATCGTGG